MRREFRCYHFRMRVLLEKTVQSKGCTLFQHERVKMVLGALLDLFWIPFGDHLGDVLALVGLFGALFGRQSAVILFILASDKAPKRTSDTLLERLEPGKLAWSLYTSVWGLCRAIWTPPGAILGPPSINS